MRHNIEIERYRAEMAAEWDRFVSCSRQPSFLFKRAYMDYHADRFADYSLVARRRGSIMAVLPAERDGKRNIVTSHRGLTYGGWITPQRHFNAATMLSVFERAIEFMRRDNAESLIYTPIPYIYTVQPAEEDRYALFCLGARQTGCGLSSAIRLHSPAPLNESTRQATTLARRNGVEVAESVEWSVFWQMLTVCLAERHDVKPTHSLEEMLLLRERFPENIRLFMAYAGGCPEAGAVVYVTPQVVHTQYMATTPKGRAIKALALLIRVLAERFAPTHHYLDFGVSTENSGRTLNRGLLLQKSGQGGLGVACPVFELRICGDPDVEAVGGTDFFGDRD